MDLVWILGYVVLAAVIVGAWYRWCVRSNRNRAIQVLQWIENSLAGEGHVTGIRWLTDSEFEVPVRMSTALFRRASFLVRISPKQLPLQWLFRRLQPKAPDTITFQADMDSRPGMNMELQTQRWFARSSKDLNLSGKGWQFVSATPVVVTTRLDWKKEVTSAVYSLVDCEHRENLNLRFSKKSPNFKATLPLETLEPTAEGHHPVGEIFRQLASHSANNLRAES